MQFAAAGRGAVGVRDNHASAYQQRTSECGSPNRIDSGSNSRPLMP